MHTAHGLCKELQLRCLKDGVILHAYKTCSGKVQFFSCKKNYMDSWRLWFLNVQYGKNSMVVKEITWILRLLETVWRIYMAV
jgi:hypothetical protein